MDLSTINDFYESIKKINKKVDTKRLNSPGTMNIAEIMNRQILMNNILSPFSVGGLFCLKKTLPVQLKQAVS